MKSGDYSLGHRQSPLTEGYPVFMYFVILFSLHTLLGSRDGILQKLLWYDIAVQN